MDSWKLCHAINRKTLKRVFLPNPGVFDPPKCMDPKCRLASLVSISALRYSLSPFPIEKNAKQNSQLFSFTFRPFESVRVPANNRTSCPFSPLSRIFRLFSTTSFTKTTMTKLVQFCTLCKTKVFPASNLVYFSRYTHHNVPVPLRTVGFQPRPDMLRSQQPAEIARWDKFHRVCRMA